jgi:hypothetical protein
MTRPASRKKISASFLFRFTQIEQVAGDLLLFFLEKMEEDKEMGEGERRDQLLGYNLKTINRFTDRY